MTNPEPSNKLNDIEILNTSSDSQLSKLLCCENITVIHDPSIRTASFNIVSRVLKLPILSGISQDVADLFIGHEIGHALFTDKISEEDLKAKIIKIDPSFDVFKSYLNIVEDIRIESKIMDKYPGFRKNFSKGYKELWDKNFFGVRDDIKSISTIDKINIVGKVGIHNLPKIDISSKEEEYFNLIKKCRSFHDSFEVARIIYEDEIEKKKNQQNQNQQNQNNNQQNLSNNQQNQNQQNQNNNQQNQNNNQQNQNQQNQNQNNNQQNQNNNQQNQNNNQQNQNNNQQNQNNNQQNQNNNQQNQNHQNQNQNQQNQNQNQQNQNQNNNQQNQNQNQGKNQIPDKAKTQSLFDANLGNNVRHTSDTIEYVNIPKSQDLSHIVVDYKQIDKELSLKFKDVNPSYLDKLTEEFNKLNKDKIDYIKKEFDIKKAADSHQRTMVAETGIIDPGKLHSYKFSDNIFKRNAIEKSGKNHGMIMILDWSGSMNDCLFETTQELLALVNFCRGNQIPFEVYAFSDRYRSSTTNEKYKSLSKVNHDHIRLQNFCLLNFLSSRMTQSEFVRMSKYLLHLANSINGYRSSKTAIPEEFTQIQSGKITPQMPEYKKFYDSYNVPSKYSTGGTPLNSSIVSLFEIIPKFQKDTNVQIVNTIILTDGEDNSVPGSTGKSITVLTDELSKSRQSIRYGEHHNITTKLCNLLKQKTQSNIIGMYLLDKGSFKSFAGRYLNKEKLSEAASFFAKNNFYPLTKNGYDSYFILTTEKDSAMSEEEFKQSNPTTVKGSEKLFVNYLQSRKKNRQFISTFVDYISKELLIKTK